MLSVGGEGSGPHLNEYNAVKQGKLPPPDRYPESIVHDPSPHRRMFSGRMWGGREMLPLSAATPP
jgi:hypothetical protein